MFAGLLLTAGSLGDRFGRRRALLAGLLTFLAGSILAALAASTTVLIVGRGVMGVGGALIMPTTLSIIVNVFGDPARAGQGDRRLDRRRAAPASPSARSSAASLMRSFSWSSVFWINVPLLAVAFVGALHLVPDSRDPHATRLDPVGALLSIAAIGSIVYAIIEAPASGWTSTARRSPPSRSGAATAVVFVGWEMRRDDADARPAAVPQPQLLRRQRRPRHAVLRHGRHRVPAGAVPAVHPRLHAARRRLRPRPRRARA